MNRINKGIIPNILGFLIETLILIKDFFAKRFEASVKNIMRKT